MGEADPEAHGSGLGRGCRWVLDATWIVQSSAREWLGSPGAVSLAAAIDLESREAVKSHDSPDLQVHCHCGGAG